LTNGKAARKKGKLLSSSLKDDIFLLQNIITYEKLINGLAGGERLFQKSTSAQKMKKPWKHIKNNLY
jgi:hypothetical protein